MTVGRRCIATAARALGVPVHRVRRYSTTHPPADVSDARQVAALTARRVLPDLTWAAIAAELGATREAVRRQVATASDRCDTDPTFRALVDAVVCRVAHSRRPTA